MDKIFISVFGYAGSGKSSLLKELLKYDTNFTRIPADYYLKDLNGDLTEFILNIDNFNWDLLESDINRNIGTKVFLPDYDFLNFKNTNKRLENNYILSKINFIDALVPFPRGNFNILVKIDDEIRKQRIISRERTDKVWKEIVLNNWPGHNLDLEKFKIDLVLDGTKDFDYNIDLIIKFLKQKNIY